MKTMIKTQVSNRVVLLTVLTVAIVGAAIAGASALPAAVGASKKVQVYLTSSSVSQNVVAGANDFNFINVVVDTSSFAHDINVSSIGVVVKPNKKTNARVVSDFTLWDGETKLSVVNDPSAELSGKNGERSLVVFKLENPIAIPKGSAKTFSVKGDISSDVTAGAVYSIGIEPVGQRNRFQIASLFRLVNKKAVPVYPAIRKAYANFSFASGGALIVTLDAATSREGLMASEKGGVQLAAFTFAATQEDVAIQRLYVTGVQANNGGWDQIRRLELHKVIGNATEVIGGVVPTSTDAVDRTVLFDLTPSPLIIPRNTSVTVIFKAETNSIEPFGIGESGEGIALRIDKTQVYAVGVQSGTTIKDITVSSGLGRPHYLFKSVPRVIIGSDLGPDEVHSGSLGYSDTGKKLFAFNVNADGLYDIGLDTVTFRITKGSSTSISNLKIIDRSAGSIVASSTPSESEVKKFSFQRLERVVGDTTRRFVLQGDVRCTAPESECFVTIQFIGDSGFVSPLPTSRDSAVQSSNFVWTDFWSSESGQLVYGDAQWANGYLVRSGLDEALLPATSTPVTFTK